MKKAYGFPLAYNNQTVIGQVFTENGESLGGWTSSNLDFLMSDLSTSKTWRETLWKA